jgi:hypothetical protein
MTNYVQQQLQGPIRANVAYKMSAWFRASSGCEGAYLECNYQSDERATGEAFLLLPEKVDEWQQFSTTCIFDQTQVEAGDLFMVVGFDCTAGNDGYIDTVNFTL